MTEVLAKAEKYINCEGALISKRESFSTHKEKSRGDKKREPQQLSLRESKQLGRQNSPEGTTTQKTKQLSFKSLTAQKGTIA